MLMPSLSFRNPDLFFLPRLASVYTYDAYVSREEG